MAAHRLVCALVAACDYIVTGDQDLLRLHAYRGIPIVDAADFLARYDAPTTRD